MERVALHYLQDKSGRVALPRTKVVPAKPDLLELAEAARSAAAPLDRNIVVAIVD